MCSLCFFVHVVEYTIAIAKKLIVVTKEIVHYHPSMDAIKKWMRLVTFHLYFQ
jgi:hypothetical protein